MNLDFNTVPYFPELNISKFDKESKITIEKDIQSDFYLGLEGIRKLPHKAQLGVYISYVYYHSLFRKIQNTSPQKILATRIRIFNTMKFMLLIKSWFAYKLNLI